MDNIFLSKFLGHPPKASKFIDFIDKVFRRLAPWVRIGSYWRGDMASIESRMNIFHLVNLVLSKDIQGDFVEVGCNTGESTVIIQNILQERSSDRTLYAFDSFEGVPDIHFADEGVYTKGDMKATRKVFDLNFEKLNLKKPKTFAGWFQDTLYANLPTQIAFALIDADLYESTLIALKEVYKRLNKGAVCMFGVYWDNNANINLTTDRKYHSPGVKKACDEFFADKPEKINILLAGNYTSGYFTKV